MSHGSITVRKDTSDHTLEPKQKRTILSYMAMAYTLNLLMMIWAAGGHRRCRWSLGSQALQSPSRQRFADSTRAQHHGAFSCVHFTIAFLIYPRVKLLSQCNEQKQAKGLDSLSLAFRLNMFSTCEWRAIGQHCWTCRSRSYFV